MNNKTTNSVPGIVIPDSKSEFIRALIMGGLIAKLTKREFTITYHTELCSDVQAAIRAVQSLGTSVIVDPMHRVVHIDACKDNASNEIYCGESATILRMFRGLDCTGCLPGNPSSVHFIKTGTLQNRQLSVPHQPTLGSLKSFYELVDNEFGCAYHSLNSSTSSQDISGIMIGMFYRIARFFLHEQAVLSKPLKSTKITFSIENPVSMPYLDLTLDMCQEFFGITFTKSIEANLTRTRLEIVINLHEPSFINHYEVHGCYSSVAPLLVTSIITGRRFIGYNLPRNDAPDQEILRLPELSHIDVSEPTISGVQFIPRQSKPVNKFVEFDLNVCPDLFPYLCLYGAYVNPIFISNTNRLANKETNRLLEMQKVFSTFDHNIKELEDGMVFIKPTKLLKINNRIIQLPNDHRIAQVIQIILNLHRLNGIISLYSTLTIEEVCAKSNPTFVKDLNKLFYE